MKTSGNSHATVSKRLKQCLCVALSASLALFCVPVGAALATQDADLDCEPAKTFSYVSIGDSFATGFGLDGSFYSGSWMYDDENYSDWTVRTDPRLLGYRHSPEGSYPQLVREMLEEELGDGTEVTLTQLAQCAMRTDDLRFLIDEDYVADSYTDSTYGVSYSAESPAGLYYTGYWSENELTITDNPAGLDIAASGITSNLDYLRADYAASIKNADLITYNMGQNNFGSQLTNSLLYGYSSFTEEDLARVLGEEGTERYYEIREYVRDIVERYSEGAITAESLAGIEQVIDALTYALVGFETNLDATLDIMYEWNPDVDIVFVLVSNLSADLNIEIDGVVIPLGTIYGKLSDIANTYAMTQSSHKDDLIFADPNLTNGTTITMADYIVNYDEGSLDDPEVRGCIEEACNYVFASPRLRQNALTTLRQKCAEQGKVFDEAAFDAAMDAGYDSMARIMQASLEIDPLPMSDFLTAEEEWSGAIDTDGLMTMYSGGTYATCSALNEIYADYAEATGTEQACSGYWLYDYTTYMPIEWVETPDACTEWFIDEWLLEPVNQAAAGLYFRLNFSWLEHPSYEGCKLMAASIVTAWDEGTTARQAFRTAAAKAAVRYAEALHTFGESFRTQLKEALREHYAEYAEQIEEILADLPEDCTAQEAIEAIAKGLGLRTADGVEDLYSAVEDAYERAVKAHHVHKMRIHFGSAASCTEDGCQTYWQCSTCGERFFDYFGTEPVECDDDLVIASYDHNWKKVSAFKLFGRVIIPSYYVCTICGKHSW